MTSNLAVKRRLCLDCTKDDEHLLANLFKRYYKYHTSVYTEHFVMMCSSSEKDRR